MVEVYSDIWAESADGLKLHARSYGPANSARTPILCLPGLARHAGDFHALAAHLSSDDVGRRVVAVDYRGRGLSDRDPDPARYSIPVELADLLVLLEAIAIPRAIFVGTSRGGLIAMALAGSRPEMVAGAVLNDVGPRIELAGLLRIKGYVGKLGQPRDLDEAACMLEALFGPQFPALGSEDWRSWAEATWSAEGGDLVPGYDPALARTLDLIEPGLELPELWPAFEVLARRPVLAIRGANSDLLSENTLRRMAETSPGVETLTVPGQGHAPLLHGAEILDGIRRLVARCDQAG